MARERRKRSIARPTAERRQSALKAFAQSAGAATDKWLLSDNPVKKRIARIEVALRDGIDWLARDIKGMYANFELVSDAYDRTDINVAVVTDLLISKGIVSEAEVQERREFFMNALQEERVRRREEKDALEARVKELNLAGYTDPDEIKAVLDAEKEAGEKLDPEAIIVRLRAESTTDEDHIPEGAFEFGGS